VTRDPWRVGAALVCAVLLGLVIAGTAATAYAIRPTATTLPALAQSTVADLTGPGAINRRDFVARLAGTWKITSSSTGVYASGDDGTLSVSTDKGDPRTVCAKEISYGHPPTGAKDEEPVSFDGSASVGKRWVTDGTAQSYWCFSRGTQVWVIKAFYGEKLVDQWHQTVRDLAASWRWR
jgi:hypothetical protein